jgi:vacuolar protein sorting-associated protein VTA1
LGYETTFAHWTNGLTGILSPALYHAAQVGIGTKAKNPAAKAYLSPLLTLLEKMKKEIGPNDAIDNDIVAAAYVENFALKVFEMTDSEDRAGKSTRGTAKKFLVAANLLELLQVFDIANVSDSVRRSSRARSMTSSG